MKIIHTATTPDGQLLEYRENPVFTFAKHLHEWMHLPTFVRVWLRLRMIQRRIDGGSWTTIGGYMNGRYYLRKGAA